MARYKVLKSVAHSFGHSFTSLLNYRGDDYVMGHLLRRARALGEEALFVDILSGEAAPASLLVPEVRDSIDGYCEWFPQLVHSHRTTIDVVRSARMEIRFDLSIERPNRNHPSYVESPYVCRIELEDDRGKVWAAELRDWWFPEAGSPPPGSDSDRNRGFSRVVTRLGQLIRSTWSRRGGSAQAAA